MAIVKVSAKAIVPQSQVARMVRADIKGGESKHEFQMSIIAAALVQALKGNTRDLPEALACATGKSKKARAYRAGFLAVGTVERVSYAGKLDDAANKPVRDAIHARAIHLAAEFERAYLCEFELATEEARAIREERKAEASASAEAATASAEGNASGATEETEETGAPDTAELAVLDVATAVNAVSDALRMGMLTRDQVALLRGSIAAFDDFTAPALAVA